MINLLANTSLGSGQAAGAQSSTAVGKAAHGHKGASDSNADSLLVNMFDSLIQEMTSANSAVSASPAAAASATTTANGANALNQLMQNLKLAGSTASAGPATSTAQTMSSGPLQMLSMLQHLAQQGAPATIARVVGGLVNAVA